MAFFCFIASVMGAMLPAREKVRYLRERGLVRSGVYA